MVFFLCLFLVGEEALVVADLCCRLPLTQLGLESDDVVFFLPSGVDDALLVVVRLDGSDLRGLSGRARTWGSRWSIDNTLYRFTPSRTGNPVGKLGGSFAVW